MGELTPNSSFTNLVDVWLADLDLEGKVAESTRALYERNMRQLVVPVFEGYALREITVSKVDQFLKRLAANKSYSMAKQARTVLSLAFGLAVRYDAIQKNPVRETSRLRKPPSQAMALSAAQVDAIRFAVRTWRRGPGLSGPPPDGQLEQIIEVMLGTSARIGEVLAIRKCDVDVTSSPATVRIAGTIVSPAGKPTRRQPHPKTLKSTRTVSVPSFTAEVLRARLVKIAAEDPDHLIFFTRNGTPLTTNNIRRRLRAVMDQAGIEGVTPHSFRRTVATVIDRAGGAELAAELPGHTSSKITKEHYIQPDEAVDPVTAEILESLAPKRAEGQS
jgi:integrase